MDHEGQILDTISEWVEANRGEDVAEDVMKARKSENAMTTCLQLAHLIGLAGLGTVHVNADLHAPQHAC